MRTILFAALVLSAVSCAAHLPAAGKASDYVVVTPPGPDWRMETEQVFYTDGRNPAEAFALYGPDAVVDVMVYPAETDAMRLAKTQAKGLEGSRRGYRIGPIEFDTRDGTASFIYCMQIEPVLRVGKVMVGPIPGSAKGLVVVFGAGPGERVTEILESLKPKR